MPRLKQMLSGGLVTLIVGLVGFGLGRFSASDAERASPPGAERSASATEWSTETVGASSHKASNASSNEISADPIFASPQAALAYLESDPPTATPGDLIRLLEAIRSTSTEALIGLISGPTAGEANILQTFVSQIFLMSAMSERDPDRVFDLIESNELGPMTVVNLAGLFSTWVGIDSEYALVRLTALKDSQMQGHALAGYINGIARQDFVQATSLYQNPDFRSLLMQHENQTRLFFSRWAAMAPEEALGALQRLGDSRQKDIALAGYYTGLARKDPEFAVEKLFSISNQQVVQRTLPSLLRSWVKRDREAALAFVSKMQKGPQKSHIVQQFGFVLAQDPDPDLIAWAVTNSGGSHQASLINAMMRNYARKAPREAIRALDNLPLGRSYSRAVSQIAQTWANQDPEAALKWANTLENPVDRDQAMQSVLNSAKQQDPQAALNLVLRSAPEGDQADLLGNVLGGWVQRNEAAALEAMNTLRGRKDFGQVVKPMLRQMAFNAPERLIALVERDTSLSLAGLASQVARGLARYSPTDAAAWAMRLPDDAHDKDDAIRSVASSWLQQDTVAASEWIASLPEGKNRDGAVRQLIHTVRRSDPEAALEWALSLGNERSSKREAKRVLQTWRQDDPAAAEAAARRYGVDP
ncbi:MAG: hypothetical protein ACFE0O_10850 [Opitutales bacterium]